MFCFQGFNLSGCTVHAKCECLTLGDHMLPVLEYHELLGTSSGASIPSVGVYVLYPVGIYTGMHNERLFPVWDCVQLHDG